MKIILISQKKHWLPSITKNTLNPMNGALYTKTVLQNYYLQNVYGATVFYTAKNKKMASKILFLILFYCLFFICLTIYYKHLVFILYAFMLFPIFLFFLEFLNYKEPLHLDALGIRKKLKQKRKNILLNSM